MAREALDYIRRNYLRETVIKHRDRAEATRVENFPYTAVVPWTRPLDPACGLAPRQGGLAALSQPAHR